MNGKLGSSVMRSYRVLPLDFNTWDLELQHVETPSWKMIIHTDGNGDGKGHISVYLAIVGTSSSLADWEVNASFSFLIFDQIHDNYTVMRGGANWYSAAARSWVWPAFLPHCEFSDPKKGFLIQDCCTVQADVYVVGVVKCLT
ncbi:hypothetical protein CQW23_08458 [Capsicum baccatum]|uniref:MATH domain-containing protein n=1 Tax=Capsicum baccatum TaxID=33114 RepID=A0A2G2X914_CAPBA|nr:hypothetical protein CQW23_08458 [Capsicum baccatum]